jgi:hypothetical protein
LCVVAVNVFGWRVFAGGEFLCVRVLLFALCSFVHLIFVERGGLCTWLSGEELFARLVVFFGDIVVDVSLCVALLEGAVRPLPFLSLDAPF